jgi:hypothetical protein
MPTTLPIGIRSKTKRVALAHSSCTHHTWQIAEISDIRIPHSQAPPREKKEEKGIGRTYVTEYSLPRSTPSMTDVGDLQALSF